MHHYEHGFKIQDAQTKTVGLPGALERLLKPKGAVPMLQGPNIMTQNPRNKPWILKDLGLLASLLFHVSYVFVGLGGPLQASMLKSWLKVDLQLLLSAMW